MGRNGLARIVLGLISCEPTMLWILWIAVVFVSDHSGAKRTEDHAYLRAVSGTEFELCKFGFYPFLVRDNP